MKFNRLLKKFYIVAITIIFICIGVSCMPQNSQSSENDKFSIVTNDIKTEISSAIEQNDNTFISTIGEFNIADYQWGIDEFPADEVLSKIENVEDLIEKGKQLWHRKLNFHPKEYHIIKTYYDVKSDCWMVTAEIDDTETDYAVPTAIIHTNGTVMAVWRE